MVKNSNQHIYYGLGTLSVLLLGAFFVYKKANSTTQSINKKHLKTINLSVFDSPDTPGSGQCIDPQLIAKLQQLERITGYPIFKRINSGARSAYWNTKVGGVSNSSHQMPFCKAVDIKTPTKSIRNRIVMAARDVGFKRIGVGQTFVHLDVDSMKSQYVAWGYPSGARPAINPFV